ncbi:hypothetical protein [Bartonella queenslandensis]|uniref:hypothetical protein n=1 Tax=Bartonella queenslandensis TaxID=481138 RepID=UPI001BAACDD9|nr:hypothetical protein [Bartonella queenslandensis]
MQPAGTISELVVVCRELGKTDASLGWLVSVANSAWLMRANFCLSDAVCTDMNVNSMIAMVLGRPGSLQRSSSGDGWLLSGIWKYASGYPYSSYFFCLAETIEENVQVVLVPSHQLKVVDEWRSIGLIATQSVTIQAENIHIPDSFVTPYDPVLAGLTASYPSSGLSYVRYFTGVLMNCLPATLLGATESALALVLEEFGVPITGSTYSSMYSSGPARYEIGRLCSVLDLHIRAAEYNASVIDTAAYEGRTLTVGERVAIRGRATQIMRGCVDIVQDLLWLRGSSSFEKGNPLEKIWRDINVGARHGGFAKLVPEELVGLMALGDDPASLTRMF